MGFNAGLRLVLPELFAVCVSSNAPLVSDCPDQSQEVRTFHLHTRKHVSISIVTRDQGLFKYNQTSDVVVNDPQNMKAQEVSWHQIDTHVWLIRQIK